MKNRFPILFLCALLILALIGCAAPDRAEKTDESGEAKESGEVKENGEAKESGEAKENGEEIMTIYLYIQGNRLAVTLADNSSAKALAALLGEGDLSYTADDYGGFEKVGSIGRSLPRNDTRIDTRPGDVILYQGNSLCLYYGENSWSFTRIGRIEGYTERELRELLGAGKGELPVRLSLR